MPQTLMPKKGDAAPLEGAVGPEIASVLNMAFRLISLSMMQSLLAPALTTKMGLGNTLANTMKGATPPGAAAAATVQFSTPKPPGMTSS